jgi:hypothetical protein
MEEIDPRSPQLTNMVLLVYAPVLVILPILLLVFIMFMVVRGGFIIVLAVLFWVLPWLIGVVALAATRRWRAHRARVRAARTDVVPVRPRGQPRFEPAAAIASTTVSLALGSRPAELGPIRDSDDRPHVA